MDREYLRSRSWQLLTCPCDSQLNRLEFFIEVGEQLDSALRRHPWLTERGSCRSEGEESAQPREPLVTLYYPCGSHSRGLSLTDVETLARATGAIEEPRPGLPTPASPASDLASAHCVLARRRAFPCCTGIGSAQNRTVRQRERGSTHSAAQRGASPLGNEGVSTYAKGGVRRISVS